MTEHRIFAAFYDRLSRVSEQRFLGDYRRRLLDGIDGDVLDVGAGTGANLPYLDDAASVVASEPDRAMRSRLTARARSRPRVETSDAAAESLPFPDGRFDAVVCTLVLCSVHDSDRALAEVRRVLKPTGSLFVLEHVRGSGMLGRWQDRLTPVWSKISGDCRLNRDTSSALERAGFDVGQLAVTDPLPTLTPARPLLVGRATIAAT